MTDPQIIYGIEEQGGKITKLMLSPADPTTQEFIEIDGLCKNIIGGHVNYAVFDNHGIRHTIKLSDTGEVVTDDNKTLKVVFSKPIIKEKVEVKAKPVSKKKGKK